MKTYNEMKKVLNSRRQNIKYFTKEFYNIFIADYRKAIDDVIKGIDAEEYINTKKTDFYNKNGGSYCEFLSCFYDKNNLNQYRLEYCVDVWGNYPGCRYAYAEDIETMRKVAMAEMEEPYKYVEVMEVV